MGNPALQGSTPAGRCSSSPLPPVEWHSDVLSSHTVCQFGTRKLFQPTLRCEYGMTLGVLPSEHIDAWKCRGIFRNWREVCCLPVPRRRREPLLAPDLEMGYTDQQESIPALSGPASYPGKLAPPRPPFFPPPALPHPPNLTPKFWPPTILQLCQPNPTHLSPSNISTTRQLTFSNRPVSGVWMHGQPFSDVFFHSTQRKAVAPMTQLDMRCVEH